MSRQNDETDSSTGQRLNFHSVGQGVRWFTHFQKFCPSAQIVIDASKCSGFIIVYLTDTAAAAESLCKIAAGRHRLIPRLAVVAVERFKMRCLSTIPGSSHLDLPVADRSASIRPLLFNLGDQRRSKHLEALSPFALGRGAQQDEALGIRNNRGLRRNPRGDFATFQLD